jgi:hypothetical protein
MPDQIIIGDFGKGLKNDSTAFNIDNDSFPFMFNFYTWRGRAKRKRGTIFLGQLAIQVVMVSLVTHPWQDAGVLLSGGSVNLPTALSLTNFGGIVPGSVSFSVINTYTEPKPPDGTLMGSPSGTGTINYATGTVSIVAGGSSTLTGTFSYFPALPVMGLEDFVASTTSLYPLLLAFDTQYSYQINGSNFYNTTFYTTGTPFTWSGQDYQQFWTINYSGALWATNNKPGMHILSGTYVSGSGSSSITFNFKLNGVNYTNLLVGDIVWFNEWGNPAVTLNGITGTITDATGAAAGNYVVTFTGNQTVSGTGIIQVFTNSIPFTGSTIQDGIRYYTGDPTSATGLPTGTNLGWVNFSPPLTQFPNVISIDNTPAAIYYLVGALAILPFKDRLLFFSPYIQTSTGVPILLKDTVLWSWNGTPYYAVSDSSNTPTTNLIPPNQTANSKAYYLNQTGFAGYLPAGISQPIITIGNNEDVLLIGFGGDGRKTRFVYTGNDIQPFLFFNINSELPSQSTFSAVVLDKGMIDIGQYGICMTDQQSCSRIDLDMPDEVFEIQSLNFGALRVNALRDFFREWIYFSYPVQNSPWKFPTQTFLFNYRDNAWAILYENFTRHGTFRRQTKKSWLTTGYHSWNAWREPWNAGSNSPQFPDIIAGNPQGYVLIKGQGTGEAISGTITAISNSAGNTQITSTNHCVTDANQNTDSGDYLLISMALGTTAINNQIGRVIKVIDANNFVIDLPFPAGTYLGLGKFTRLSQPFLQTKQFPFYWEQGRKVRLCAQKYLLDATANSQITVNINLSQDPDTSWNKSPIVPNKNVTNSGLEYSQIVFTCPETINLGLTPANTNLQMPTSVTQNQIWHRMNTSLIGDSVQIGITLSDAQMRNIAYATDEIVLHSMQLTVEPGPILV